MGASTQADSWRWSVPPLPAWTARRPRLLDALTAEPVPPLTLLVGRPGTGKTTLAAQWAALHPPAAWCTVSHQDNDPPRFARDLAMAVDRLAPGSTSTALEAAGAEPFSERTFASALADDVAGLGERVLVVLDDYHLIVDGRAHELVAHLIDWLPPAGVVALTTRVVPPLRLARRRARGEVREVMSATLDCTPGEAGGLLERLVGHPLPEETTRLLHERTDGWVAGLMLASQALRAGLDPAAVGSRVGRDLADYLAEELFDDLAPDVRTFLRRTSILAKLSKPLCAAVVGAPIAPELFADLDRLQLMLPVDDEGRWWRYHPLVADYAHHRLLLDESEIEPELHRRASQYLAEHGDVEPAVEHALRGGDYDRATKLMGDDLVIGNTRSTPFTYAFLAALPQTYLDSRPDIHLAAAWIMSRVGRTGEAIELLRRATTGDDGEPALEALQARAMLCSVAGDIPGAIAALSRLSALDQPADLQILVLTALGLFHWCNGDLDVADATLARAQRRREAEPGDTGEGHYIGSYVYRALIGVERGDVATAAADVERARARLAAFPADAALERLVDLGEGAVELGAGNAGQATVLLERSLEANNAVAMPLLPMKLLLVARGRVAAGDITGAHEALAEAERLIGELHDPANIGWWLARAAEPAGYVPSAPAARPTPPTSAVGSLAEPLSSRELAVLRLLRSELSLREIASELYVSHNTVKSHTQAIYRKLGARGRREAIEVARGLALVS